MIELRGRPTSKTNELAGGTAGHLEREALAIFVHPASVDFGSAAFAAAQCLDAEDFVGRAIE